MSVANLAGRESKRWRHIAEVLEARAARDRYEPCPEPEPPEPVPSYPPPGRGRSPWPLVLAILAGGALAALVYVFAY